jgi:hypothetical protein
MDRNPISHRDITLGDKTTGIRGWTRTAGSDAAGIISAR